jgi:hypothetical protein
MKHILFLLVVTLLFGCNKLSFNDTSDDDIISDNYIDEENDTSDNDVISGDYINEEKVLKILLDSVESDQLKNERFVVIFYNCKGIFVIVDQPLYVIAWFNYSNDSEYITVSYFPFYEKPKTSLSYYNGASYSDYLKEIVHNKGFVNIENAKQFKMPLPKGLQTDILFNKMQKSREREGIEINDGDSLAWGFKSNKAEFISCSIDWYSFSRQVEQEILMPVIAKVYHHEQNLKRQENAVKR